MAMIQFFVEGTPVTEGSTRAFRRGGKTIIVHDNPGLETWRKRITAAARDAALAAGWTLPYPGPVNVSATFYLNRGKTVTRTLPHVKPDLDKLARAVGDGLAPKRMTGIIDDDGQIVQWTLRKTYAVSVPGVYITVEQA